MGVMRESNQQLLIENRKLSKRVEALIKQQDDTGLICKQNVELVELLQQKLSEQKQSADLLEKQLKSLR